MFTDFIKMSSKGRLCFRIQHARNNIGYKAYATTVECINHEKPMAVNSLDDDDFKRALPFDAIPGPKGLPYLGTVPYYMTGQLNRFNYQDILKKYYQKYGPIFKETIVGKTIVHTYQPEMINIIYQDEGKQPVIEPLLETAQRFRKNQAMSLGLGNSNGELWYKLRTAVQKHMMKPLEVAAYLPQVNQVANEFVEKLITNGQCNNFLLESSKWSLESSGYIGFGKRLGYLESGTEREQEASNMVHMNDQTFTISTKLKFSMPFFKYIKTPSYSQLHVSEKYFADVSDKYLDETLSDMNSRLTKDEDISAVEKRFRFVYSLFAQKNLTRKDMGIIALSMFGDGLRTTIPALTSAMYCLAMSQEVQNKLYKEVHSVLGDRSTITVTDISKMAYLKACVKEVLRLYPIGLEVSRINRRNMVLGSYQIPANTSIHMNNFYMFKNNDYFENPNSFLPERWLRGDNSSVVNPLVLMPFGRGPRMCAGRRFAEQDLYVVISKIIQRSKIQWLGGEYKQQFKMLVYPDCESKFLFEPR